MKELASRAQVQRLVDRTEITELVDRLGVALDEQRFDDLRSVFVEDASAHTAGGTAEGREALINQARRHHVRDERTQHVTTNVVVTLDGDRAEVRANLLVHFAPASGGTAEALAPSVGLVVGEVYRFEAVRTSDGWRFRRVEATPLWTSGNRPSRVARSVVARVADR